MNWLPIPPDNSKKRANAFVWPSSDLTTVAYRQRENEERERDRDRGRQEKRHERRQNQQLNRTETFINISNAWRYVAMSLQSS